MTAYFIATEHILGIDGFIDHRGRFTGRGGRGSHTLQIFSCRSVKAAIFLNHLVNSAIFLKLQKFMLFARITYEKSRLMASTKKENVQNRTIMKE